MSESSPVPVLEVPDSEPVGYCKPDSNYCALPGEAAVDDPEDASKGGSAGPDEDD